MPMTYVNCETPKDHKFSRSCFPDGFVFGTGSAAYQVARVYGRILHGIQSLQHELYSAFSNLDSSFSIHSYRLMFIVESIESRGRNYTSIPFLKGKRNV
jgi:hypothetical protein